MRAKQYSDKVHETVTRLRDAANRHEPTVLGSDEDRRAKAKREFGKWADLREAANKEALRSEKR